MIIEQDLDSQTIAALQALKYRAVESKLPFGLFTDLQAVRWLEEIGFEFAPPHASTEYVVQLATACRTKIFNDVIKDFEGRVVNLGCGFCTRGMFHDKQEWIDIDLAEVMDMRNELSAAYGKVLSLNICGDILDDVFVQSLTTDLPCLVLLEGVLDYFTKEQVVKILKNLRKTSREITIIFDACGTVYTNVPHPTQSINNNPHVIRFGLDVPEELEHLGYKVVQKTYVHEIAKDRWEPLEENFKQYPIMKDHASRVVVLEGV